MFLITVGLAGGVVWAREVKAGRNIETMARRRRAVVFIGMGSTFGEFTE
jgi:hypothetical protein